MLPDASFCSDSENWRFASSAAILPLGGCCRWMLFVLAESFRWVIRRQERMMRHGEHTENQKPFGDRAAIQTFAPLLCSDNADLYAEYYEWLDQATQAQDAYLSGRLSEENALKAIRKS